jgi:hypothetical protein
MFGTLIIQLPSLHEGGELVIFNNDNSRSVHDFGVQCGRNPYSIYFAAHYADVEHEILEVKNGYRIALIYSLCWNDSISISSNVNSKELVDKMIECLNYLNDKSYRLAFLLDHQYTHASFSDRGFKALKEIDLQRYNLLKNSNDHLLAERQLNFYVANCSLVIDSYDVVGNYRLRGGTFVSNIF